MRMDKSPDAFRTISEVSEVLDTPAHVLRFWESRFPQIKPVKRAGGRRYYRPSDIALLTGIKRLLHDEGLTIRGVQKILREQGVRHVAGLTDETLVMDEVADVVTPDAIQDNAIAAAPVEPPAQTVLPFPAPAPRPVDDSRSFASRIRGLPLGSLTAQRGDVARLARRLIGLRTRLAEHAETGRG
jgi:DNA-binding transcriptional MerR regulator